MNARQASELENAITRCTELGIEPIAQGHMKADNKRCFIVPSQSERAGHNHLVIVDRGRLICDCTAALYGHVCCHRASVHIVLVNEASRAETLAAKVTAALEEEDAKRGEVELVAREAQAAADRREVALLVHSNAPFSIFK
jgi:hypothetical protein